MCPYKGIIDPVNKVGYIKLNSFTQTAGQEVRTAIKELKEQGATKMVLDLRGNGGGLLREAVNIVNLFVPKNEVGGGDQGQDPRMGQDLQDLERTHGREIPLVVLVDGQSASASEIVSGALQDLDRAVVVGNRTYGKGLVQQTRDLYYNSKLKVTVAKYYIPSGRCIQKLDYAQRQHGQGREGGRRPKPSPSSRPQRKSGLRWPRHPARRGRAGSRTAQGGGGLYTSDIFFDFANQYRMDHDSIAPPNRFEVTDAIYDDFLAFAKDRDFEYRTESQEDLEQLITDAKKERYYEHSKAAIEALRTELNPDKAEELQRFKEDIKEVLKSELVTRYWYQTGRVEAMLHSDPAVKQALGVLNGPAYQQILAGTHKAD
jgi:carboxyl-terminal processing protease